jgi:preprotein translocase subunit SecE
MTDFFNNDDNIRILVALISFGLLGLVSYLCRSYIQSAVSYIKESYSELVTKVTWPTWKELQESSVLVFVASLLIAGVVFVMDWAFGVNTSDSIWKGVVGTIYDLF